jgi:hypothetical protein
MGANQSQEQRESAPPPPPHAPRTAWYTSADDQQPQLPLPEVGGGDGGDDSDSDVEFDCQSVGAPTPAFGAVSEYADGGAGVVPEHVDAAVDASMPAWAEGGMADEPCSSSLELQFVYGVRGTDCRRNAFFTASGEIAMHAASLVVLYEPRRHAQRFLRGHDGEVRCLALHPSGRMLASGQAAGGSREVCVWQLDASEPAVVLTGQHPDGVSCLGFSPSGEYLAAIGSDPMHTIVLWDWKRGMALASQQVAAEPIFDMRWSPVEAALATVGVRCVKLWGVDAEERGLTGHSAQLHPSGPGAASFPAAGGGGGGHQPRFLCCAYLRTGMLVAGTSRGEVWCWSGTSLCARFRAHDGPIFCLEVERTEGHLLSGGKDGKLRLWRPGVRSSHTRAAHRPSARAAHVRAPCAHPTSHRLRVRASRLWRVRRRFPPRGARALLPATPLTHRS